MEEPQGACKTQTERKDREAKRGYSKQESPLSLVKCVWENLPGLFKDILETETKKQSHGTKQNQNQIHREHLR